MPHLGSELLCSLLLSFIQLWHVVLWDQPVQDRDVSLDESNSQFGQKCPLINILTCSEAKLACLLEGIERLRQVLHELLSSDC